jgi:hypothetical protein
LLLPRSQIVLTRGEQQLGVRERASDRDEIGNEPRVPDLPLLPPELSLRVLERRDFGSRGGAVERTAELFDLLQMRLRNTVRVPMARIHFAPVDRQDVVADDAPEAVPDQHDAVVLVRFVERVEQHQPLRADLVADADIRRE